MKTFIASIFIIISLSLQAKIVEIKNIKNIKEHITDDTFVIFDIDNCILEKKQLLGSDQWFDNTLKEYSKKMELKEALKKALNQWYEVEAITEAQLVEQETNELIKGLQAKNLQVMGLTTRDLDFMYTVLKQLKSLDVNLTKTSPYDKNIIIDYEGESILYRKGILFAAGEDKGEVLKRFLDKIKFTPKRIVFIDDKQKNVNQVAKFCADNEIDYVGVRYSYLDEKIKKYDRRISDRQLAHFGQILSDDEAQNINHLVEMIDIEEQDKSEGKG